MEFLKELVSWMIALSLMAGPFIFIPYAWWVRQEKGVVALFALFVKVTVVILGPLLLMALCLPPG